MTSFTQFFVAKNDLKQVEIVEMPSPERHGLPDEALLIKVDRFAFTANNITYALLGDALKYWQLFPAPASAPKGFGNIPVWGFGEVIASRHPQIDAGERLFGYFPMATHLVIEAADVSRRGLRDAAAHRQGVAPVYNAYARVGDDALYAGRSGDHQALLRPLFMLSFLVDNYLAEMAFFGANCVILSSASSKVAIGLAHLLHTRRAPIRVIGLTSAANAAFVESLDCYDEIVTYENMTSLLTDRPVGHAAAYVDMAGDGDLRSRLHRHLGDRLVYSGRIGLTHQSTTAEGTTLPGATPTWFFAPDQIRKRAREWGPGGIEQRFGRALSDFIPMIDGAIALRESRGPAAVEQVYRETLNGRARPNQGHILSLWP